MDSLYENSGLEGIIHLVIEQDLQKKTKPKPYQSNDLMLARWYACLGEKDIALDYLERAYIENPGPLLRIKYELIYVNLRTEPRFLALLGKMNLGGYE